MPMWPSQSWHPILITLLLLPPVTLPRSKNLLSLPEFPKISHPLHKKMSLLICLLSSNSSKALASPPLLIEVITSSWPEGKASQYQTYLQKLLAFCRQQRCDILSPPIPMAVDFLSMLYERGSSYSTINTALSCCRLSYSSTPIYPFRLDSYQLSSAS